MIIAFVRWGTERIGHGHIIILEKNFVCDRMFRKERRYNEELMRKSKKKTTQQILGKSNQKKSTKHIQTPDNLKIYQSVLK